MTEQWRPVPGWVGFYEVSDLGNVRSVDRVINHPRVGPSSLRGRVLKQSPTGDGYLVVTLVDSCSGRRRVAKVHQLVLEGFVGLCPDGLEGCHANDIGVDNRLGNLRWDTRRGNIIDQVRNGTHNFLGQNRRKWSA